MFIMKNVTNNDISLPGIVNESQYNTVLIFICAGFTIFAFFGIISNAVNIKTFFAMGLKDSVTVSFLALSVFDLTYLISTCCFTIALAFSLIEKDYFKHFPIEPYGVYILFGHVLILINVTNTLTTTFLAVARCMCVAKPLHFKHSFTVKRTVVIMTGFAVFAVAIYTPLLANMGMVPRLDPKTNTSRPMLWLSPYRDSVKNVVWTLIQTLLPVVTDLSLRTAFRFRKASQISVCDREVSNAKGKTDSSNDTSDKLSGKDIRVVKQVTFISLVYIMCNTPKVVTSIVSLIEVEFSLRQRYNNLYLCFNYFRMNFEIFNASINTFIYYAYNTKFKTTLSRQ
ncbi:unnamed protein product [Candidula unifasciata]|uniref:G-protein coupled receptors family 1 profile domain-containing protein n=1 Tax=Candidula unifasciata TaxID=100452 RepID=A0A8S3ZH39_9EUPU|nr:unnamed protein product [Candidula unifasciata]